MRIKKLLITLLPVIVAACSSNNCPVENTVYCNISYIDSEGNAIKYSDGITVSTLMPGWKIQYIYRRLGYTQVVSDTERPDLIEEGYTESTVNTRNTKVLINQVTAVSRIQVPMSYFNDVDTLVFNYENITQADTLYITKENYPHVDYPECGVYQFHTITGIRFTNVAFDTIQIANPAVNHEGNDNINIRFNGTD